MPQLSPLPIDEVLGDVTARLRGCIRRSCCVAPPGAGKTTRVPPAMLDAGLAADGKDPRPAAAARRRPGHRRPDCRRARLAAGRGSRLPGAVRVARRPADANRDHHRGHPAAAAAGRSVSAGRRRSSSSTNSTSGRWPATWRWRWSGRSSSRCGPSCGSSSCRPRSPPSRSPGISATARSSKARAARFRSKFAICRT